MACQMHCHLRKCIQGALDPTQARVEVKGYEVSAEERADMSVAWMDNGEAAFHDICWKAVIDSYKNDNPFELGAREKSLVKESWKTAEYFDSSERIRREAKRVAQMIKSSKYAIAFTGAGISTNAGIGDFRGRAGKWTERDRERIYGKATIKKASRNFVYESLRPTYTHEALMKLSELGLLKHVISQNTDGLHRLSGLARDRISELHGNSFHEKCERCTARYERPYAVRPRTNANVPPKICQHCNINHRTGRRCERKGCDGYLMNIIINFGDGLEHHVLSTAEEHAQKNDLVLVLGSSLRVTPACDLVEMGQKPIRLIICNRQTTPFDELCYQVTEKAAGPHGARIFSDCDFLMKQVMSFVLDDEALRDWEEGSEERLMEYDKLRGFDLEDDRTGIGPENEVELEKD